MEFDNQTFDALKREFLEFLELEEHNGKYIDKIKEAISERKFRLIVNINELRNFQSVLPEKLMKSPRQYILALQQAAKESAENADPSFAKILRTNELQVGFEGSFGQNSVSPRGLLSTMLNNLVQVEGIVTKCSLVRPKLVRSTHYCPFTKAYSFREYRDATAMDLGIDTTGHGESTITSAAMPTKDKDGNALDTELGYCLYKDYQSVILQEMPERAKVGQLPRSVELILEHDLVDRVKPGDRIQCVGVYRPMSSTAQGQSSGIFRSTFICNNVSIIGKEVGAVQLSGVDIKHIRELSVLPNVLDILAQSLCPSIFGHSHVKTALILQLLGGCERNLENGTHLRGDINVMMVGDPSTAKSQLLRAVLDIAPLAISTTGRGSSGVGLTAAVTSDPDTNERRLEAGAMVLADRGIVCIDEFDKMNENDRVAIHEVMEQQTVTIAKAGIHASLNARCSVLAAANPVYGQYDRTRRAQENIGLPDSLLSRFDLLFIVLDQMDPVMDRRISEHVVKSHQYRRPGTIMEPEPMNQVSRVDLDEHRADAVNDIPVWQRGGKSVQSSVGALAYGAGKSHLPKDYLTKDFLRKYIHYAKNKCKPVLSDEAMEAISNAYAQMRVKQSTKNLPITARSLETIIRLSSACAKARLSMSVDGEDVEVAVHLLNFVLFHEYTDNSNDDEAETDVESELQQQQQPSRTGNRQQQTSSSRGGASSSTSSSVGASVDEDAITSEEENAFDDDEEQGIRRAPGTGLLGKRGRDALGDEEENDEYSSGFGSSLARSSVNKMSSRFQRLTSTIADMGGGKDMLQLQDVLMQLNRELARGGAGQSLASPYNQEEVEVMLKQLERENKIMYDDDDETIHIIT